MFPFPKDEERTSLLEKSYIAQRNGMAILAAMLPVALIVTSLILRGFELKASISAYYWAEDLERNILVGALVSVGVFLILYKGYNRKEDRILDVAGAAALGVAFFPMGKSSDGISFGASAHGTFAVLFFVCIAYICIFMSEHSLEEVSDAGRRTMFRRAYRACSGIMILSVALAVLYPLLPSKLAEALRENSIIFWIEALAIWAFSAFWYIKTRELDPSRSWVPLR